jgi:hypothetical protein
MSTVGVIVLAAPFAAVVVAMGREQPRGSEIFPC